MKSSFGSSLIIESKTVSPPSPESKIPMGRLSKIYSPAKSFSLENLNCLIPSNNDSAMRCLWLACFSFFPLKG